MSRFWDAITSPQFLIPVGVGLIGAFWPRRASSMIAGLGPIPALPATSTFIRADLIPLAREKARKYGVPEEGFIKQIWVESRFNPNAVGPDTSWGQAKGIAQFIDATASDFNIDPMDPEQALDAGAKYMKRLHDRYVGQGYADIAWSLAAAGYNWGPGNVDKFVKGQKSPPGETKRYVEHVHAYYGELNPLSPGFTGLGVV